MEQYQLSKNTTRLNPVDKKIIGGSADVNQLLPLKYNFAYDMYKKALANFWIPEEVNMSSDISDIKLNKLNYSELRILKLTLGFFSTADSLAQNNIVLGMYSKVTSPECRLFLTQQAYFEAIHTQSYAHIIQTLGLDESEIFNMYHEIDVIRDKDEFLLEFINTLLDKDLDTSTVLGKQKFLKSVIVFACIMEGLFFYTNFAQILALGRQNKIKGTAEQIAFIMRDETLHYQFGSQVALEIIAENPEIWTQEFKDSLIPLFEKAVQLEMRYAHYSMPNGGFLGMTVHSFEQFLKYICNIRMQSIGLEKLYPEASQNPFGWMFESIEAKKETNFFEARVKEYQSASVLDWGDTEDTHEKEWINTVNLSQKIMCSLDEGCESCQ